MVGIRKVEGRNNVQPAETKAEGPEPLSAPELSQILVKVFADLQVHGNEIPALANALKRAGDLKPELLKNIETRLADPNLRLTPQTLEKLKGLGLDVTRATENLKKNTDLKTTAQLGQTTEKHVEAKVVGEAASHNAIGAQKAVIASHAGTAVAKNELRPEYKLAKELAGEYVGRVYANKAPPEMKAVVDAVGPHVSSLAEQTALSVMQDPNTMANMAQLLAKVGKEGFKEALASSTKEVSGHFLKSAGIQAKNPAAIKAALSGMEQAAPLLGTKLGPKLAAAAQKLGPRLVGEGVEIAAKAAVAGGAQAGAAAVSKGAALTAAKAGAEALPVVGNVVAAGSFCLAGASLVGQMFKKPHSWEKTMKEGINTALQGIGIAFPWVALGGTLFDAGWSAKLGVSDAKKQAAGIPVTENAKVADALPLLHDSAEVLHSVLTGAGHGQAAGKLANLMTTTKTMGQLDLNKPGDRLSMLRKDEQQAVVELSQVNKGQLEELAKGETGSRKEGVLQLASVFGELGSVVASIVRFDKREGTPGFDEKAKKDLEVKRNELAGHLVKQLGNLGVAEVLRRAEAQGTAGDGTPLSSVGSA